MTDSKSLDALLAEHHSWPTDYTFKFIVPAAEESALMQRLESSRGQLTRRLSAKGSFVCVTATVAMQSPDAVLAVYAQVSDISGLIAL